MQLTFSPELIQQDWIQLQPVPNSILEQPWRQWLLDSGSLTQNLKDLAPGRFSVQLLHTGFGRASLSESKTLTIPYREQVYIREVALCIDDKPVIFARSIIPRSTLSGAERQLLFLKSKPLGEFLFSHKKMRRGSIQVKSGSTQSHPCWGRRSVFYLNEKPLLVSEFFTDALFQVK